jgi:hypothetical protein
MAANTGRTTEKWVDFRVDDSGGTLRSIPVDSINGVGLDYDETDLTAFQDAIKGVLPAMANCQITITGPFDSSVVASAGTLSGSHTVLYNLPGGVTPLSLDVQFGVRHAYDTEPQFGITSTAANGFLCKSYQVDPKGVKYTAVFVVAAGSAAPAWGLAAEA